GGNDALAGGQACRNCRLLVLDPAPIAAMQPAEQQVSPCEGKVRIEQKKILVIRGRLFVTPQTEQRSRAIQQRFGQARTYGQRPAKTGYGFFVACKLLEREAAHEKRIGRFRILLGRFAEEMLRFVELPLLTLQKAEQVK